MGAAIVLTMDQQTQTLLPAIAVALETLATACRELASHSVQPKQPSPSKSRDYIDTKTLAARTAVAAVTWEQWRLRREGPPYFKLGRRCLYEWTEVERWIEEQRVLGGEVIRSKRRPRRTYDQIVRMSQRR